MRQSKYIRKCGPFEVQSISQDGHGVRLEIYPAFPQYNIPPGPDIDPSWVREPRWAIHRYRGEGGGPGIFSAIGLAKEFEDWLNQFYTQKEVDDWKNTLAEALKKVRDKDC